LPAKIPHENAWPEVAVVYQYSMNALVHSLAGFIFGFGKKVH
jgi:hypothetical protein